MLDFARIWPRLSRASAARERGANPRGEFLWRFERDEVADARERRERAVGEELGQPVVPGGGKSGSCSGQNTVVGTAIRSSGAGGTSARLRATVPDPARYHTIEAVNAPGSPYRSARRSRSASLGTSDGPDQCDQKWRR